MKKNTTKKTTKSPIVLSARDQAHDIQSLRVGYELIDTAWRMTVPVVLFAGIGIFVDRSLGAKPWFTLLGMIIGFVFAGILVKRQIGEDLPFLPSATLEKNNSNKPDKIALHAEQLQKSNIPKDAPKNDRYGIFGYNNDDYYSQGNGDDTQETNLTNKIKSNGKDDA